MSPEPRVRGLRSDLGRALSGEKIKMAEISLSNAVVEESYNNYLRFTLQLSA